MLPWRKHLRWFSNFLIQNVLYISVLSNKVSYIYLFVCSAALRWCCSSVLKRWKGLKMLLLLNLGFLWVRRKPACLSQDCQAIMGFPHTIFSFYLNLIFFHFDFRILGLFGTTGFRITSTQEFHYSLCVLGQKVLGGVNLSWTSGCRYLQK